MLNRKRLTTMLAAAVFPLMLETVSGQTSTEGLPEDECGTITPPHSSEPQCTVTFHTCYRYDGDPLVVEFGTETPNDVQYRESESNCDDPDGPLAKTFEYQLNWEDVYGFGGACTTEGGDWDLVKEALKRAAGVSDAHTFDDRECAHSISIPPCQIAHFEAGISLIDFNEAEIVSTWTAIYEVDESYSIDNDEIGHYDLPCNYSGYDYDYGGFLGVAAREAKSNIIATVLNRPFAYWDPEMCGSDCNNDRGRR